MMMPQGIRQSYLNVINFLVLKDEVELALKVCEMVPGYFRDNKIKEFQDLKNLIVSRIATASKYAIIDNQTPDEPAAKELEHFKQTLRAEVIRRDVLRLNDAKLIPVVMDFAPGGGLLERVLRDSSLGYRYDYSSLKHKPTSMPQDVIKSSVKIFVACEIIEHLWNPQDIRTEMLSSVGVADVIHLSTPKYTFDEFTTDWTKRDLLGHLRTYTPTEFCKTVNELFPEYELRFYDSQVMHIRGVRHDADPLITRQIDLN